MVRSVVDDLSDLCAIDDDAAEKTYGAKRCQPGHAGPEGGLYRKAEGPRYRDALRQQAVARTARRRRRGRTREAGARSTEGSGGAGGTNQSAALRHTVHERATGPRARHCARGGALPRRRARRASAARSHIAPGRAAHRGRLRRVCGCAFAAAARSSRFCAAATGCATDKCRRHDAGVASASADRRGDLHRRHSKLLHFHFWCRHAAVRRIRDGWGTVFNLLRQCLVFSNPFGDAVARPQETLRAICHTQSA